MSAGALAAGLAVAAIAIPAAAAERIFSYDAVSTEARALSGVGLTFQFRTGLLGAPHVERVMLTGQSGTADVRPAPYSALGPGGLDAVIGANARERALYEINPNKSDGHAFIRAACLGSKRMWLAVGAIRYGLDLKVDAIGDDPATGKARLCATYQFRFRGEWKLPENPVEPLGNAPPEPQF